MRTYLSTHRDTMARELGYTSNSGGSAFMPLIEIGAESGWAADLVLRDLNWDILGSMQAGDARASAEIPQYLDGFEDAARAAAVAGTSADDVAAGFADLAFHVDRLYPFATIAVAIQPAQTMTLDGEGRPHSEEGPALVWEDGTSVYAWHGRLVPPELVAPDRPVTYSRIVRELDVERRAVLIERYGLGRYLLEAGATEIHKDDCGRLYRLAQRFGEPIEAVRVVNHTPEPDGSRHEFWLRVPPTMTTAREAVAWTFDLPAAAYDPIAQS